MKALPVIMNVPSNPKGYAEIYIAVFVLVVVHIKDITFRTNKAVPLTIHVIGRPLLSQEPIIRKYPISHEKLVTEAGQSELKPSLDDKHK